MKKIFWMATVATLLAAGGSRGVSIQVQTPETSPYPWETSGLTEEETARHLLDRFAFGPRPGDIATVLAMGPEAWFEAQLGGEIPDGELEDALEPFRTLDLSIVEITRTYPNPGVVTNRALAWARQNGIITQAEQDDLTNQEINQIRAEYMETYGIRSQNELTGELMAHKLVRAVYSENQLEEVLADFWFNHFNITVSKNQARPYVVNYELEAIRPYVLGNFREMLGATAKHPAMLLYLDNAMSNAEQGAHTTAQMALAESGRSQRDMPRGMGRGRRGLNENYAREIMELHTLGVEAFNQPLGYSQGDVEEVARAFTGWTFLPPEVASRLGMGEMNDDRQMGGMMGEDMGGMMERDDHPELSATLEQAESLGFVAQEGFLFRADMHDADGKLIMGNTFPAGGGVEEGERVMDLLVSSPWTARFISKKLAIRFVSDTPSDRLVDAMATRFSETGGDLREVMKVLFWSDEFWSVSSVRSKIKSPFEVVASALRALDVQMTLPRASLQWVERMGQPLYRYEAPTGYPDRADAWVNAGSLLSRMNFGLNLAMGRVRGVRFDLRGLNTFGGVFHEPESIEHALEVYAGHILDGRDLTDTLALLAPVVADPDFAQKVESATPDSTYASGTSSMGGGMSRGGGMSERRENEQTVDWDHPVNNPKVLAQVVGVLLGSPEFQRR